MTFEALLPMTVEAEPLEFVSDPSGTQFLVFQRGRSRKLVARIEKLDVFHAYVSGKSLSDVVKQAIAFREATRERSG